MRKKTAIMSSILIALFGMFSAAQDAFAVDPPHNGQNTIPMPITCDVCHYDPASVPSWATDTTGIDNTYFNNLCTSCHNVSEMTRTTYVVKTHSSTYIASGKYPPWTLECRACHNPHYQDQISSYTTDSTSNLRTGTITSYSQVPVGSAYSTIIVSDTGGTDNWKDFMLVPNILYPTRMYRIFSNTPTSFTVIGVVNANYARATNTWAVRLSSMLLAQLRTPLGALETVKFFTPDSSKPNSYASSTNSANVTGICQVCHTQTQSFNRTATRTGGTGSIQEGPNHPAVIATGQKCTQCHIHTEGFKGECNTCHGSPPIDAATLISRSSTGATVTSDSPGAGAHGRHATSLGYDCATCHTGGMLSGQSAGDNKINIGFFLLSSNLGGSYDGKFGRNYYSYASGTGSPTTVTSGGTLRCTNLYCHSSGQGSTSQNGTPVYSSPSWTNPASGACGTCHQTRTGHALGPITSGSHTTHIAVSGTGCDDCHPGAAADASSYVSTTHVNRNIDVAYNYTAGGTPGNGYGTCSQVSCHASPYSASLIATPTWGTIASCNACHSANPIAATGPNTGGHALHNETDCQRCHNAGTTSTSKPSTEHANGFIDTANVGYTDNKAKGSPYTTCSTASCHANVYGSGTSTTPVWGSTGNGCSACHSAYPIQTYGPNTGGHALHNETDCQRCHNAGTTSTSVPSTEHANGFIDTALVGYTDNKAKGSPYTTCSTANCHANVYGAGTTTTPAWGTTGNDCSACHSVPITPTGPNTGSHALHANSASTVCTNCHKAGTTATTRPSTSHADGFINVTSGYNPIVAKHPVGSGYQSCSATACHGTTSPVWGANTTNAQCVKCHGVAGTSTTSYIANSDLAAPGYNAAGRATSGSSGNPTSGGVSPDQQVGAHDTHLRGLGGYKTNGIVCTDCHAVSSLTDSGHMNGGTTFAWSSLATNGGALTPSYAGGVCSNIACHGMSANVVNRGTDTTPSWTDGSYIPSAAAALTSCGVCHQSPPPKYRNGTTDHPGVTLGTNACNACHQHTGSGATHIDGTLQATGGDCSSCHDYDVDANGDWGKNPKAVEGFGAHAMHIKHLKDLYNVTLNATSDNFDTSNFNAVCGVCHTRDSGNHDMGGTPNTRTINFGDGRALYSFATASGLPVYYGQTDVSSASIQKTCSNVSCHFQPAPVWQGL